MIYRDVRYGTRHYIIALCIVCQRRFGVKPHSATLYRAVRHRRRYVFFLSAVKHPTGGHDASPVAKHSRCWDSLKVVHGSAPYACVPLVTLFFRSGMLDSVAHAEIFTGNKMVDRSIQAFLALACFVEQCRAAVSYQAYSRIFLYIFWFSPAPRRTPPPPRGTGT